MASPSSPDPGPYLSPRSLPVRSAVMTESMFKEEQELLKKREKQAAAYSLELRLKREQDVTGGAQVIDEKQKRLDLLLGHSKVRRIKLNLTSRQPH
jgi:hypothetical protein